MKPNLWRKINAGDRCCMANNLRHGYDVDRSIIDGSWVCLTCGKHWIGKGKDKYIDHELETLTDFGKLFYEASDKVIMEGKHLNFTNVMGRIALDDRDKLDQFLNA